MAQLIDAGYLKANSTLYSKDKKHTATILPDGKVKNSVGIGSIHEIAGRIKGTNRHNGWTFWHHNQKGTLVLIDEHRQNYRTQFYSK